MPQSYCRDFHNRSISDLVHELNSLGADHVAIQPTTLIAIHETDSLSFSKFVPSSHQQPSQFYLTDSSQKKYKYHEVVDELEAVTVASFMSKFEQGFDTTLVMQSSAPRFRQILQKIEPWFHKADSSTQCLANALEYRIKTVVDLLASRNPLQIESHKPTQLVYTCTFEDLRQLRHESDEAIKVIKLRKKTEHGAELRLLLLPRILLTSGTDDPYLKMIKTQFSQILNYIRTNPSKKYENMNKLLPKRYPATTAMAQILLYNSANYVLNWVADDSGNRSLTYGRFDFYDRLSNVSNFIKKNEDSSGFAGKKVVRYQPKDLCTDRKKGDGQKMQTSRQMGETDNLESNNRTIPFKQSQNSRAPSELEYCRTFERKTHKCSFSELESAEDRRNEEDLVAGQAIKPECNESEAILILKSQHAREVSQYHQTIQSLNAKIMVLMADKGLQELYTIHERQIMLLELKIQDLRDQMSKLCTFDPADTQSQADLRTIIKQLNEEVARHEQSQSVSKVSQGRIRMLQKEVQQLKEKNYCDQIARKELSGELEAMTARLKIKDKEYENIIESNLEKVPNIDMSQLAPKEQEAMTQIYNLLQATDQSSSQAYLKRKIGTILADLSQTRQKVLECNDFLVELQDLLEGRLSQKDPDMVLDCNRFIRTYLLNNLDIF